MGAVNFGDAGGPLTVAGLVAVMNVVNLSDGADGLAAGVCAISAITFSIIAFDLDRNHAAVFAAITAGAALGFLIHNFHPASVYMGDCGSNLLGLLLGCIAVEGAVKTQAVLALLFPLVVLAVPFLDTTFVVLKRMKYRRPIYRADANHFHHRLTPHRLQPAPDRALPLRVDDPARRLRGGAALRALLRPPRPLPHGLDGRRGRRSACS